ncbi:hypothetical protein L2E82_39315 [Cichorium intybus]|uniref:Uncharacterized protein n=1 Tax=Cichorium intybus TaxID=13427 RepID=A0ACB9AHW5_CICIN|nr:hypothetical protein L2E82_39315 [Cichorium intybus]
MRSAISSKIKWEIGDIICQLKFDALSTISDGISIWDFLLKFSEKTGQLTREWGQKSNREIIEQQEELDIIAATGTCTSSIPTTISTLNVPLCSIGSTVSAPPSNSAPRQFHGTLTLGHHENPHILTAEQIAKDISIARNDGASGNSTRGNGEVDGDETCPYEFCGVNEHYSVK